MKKLFTLVMGIVFALSSNAAVEVGQETFTVGTPIALTGGWDGRYCNLSEDMNFDATNYDYIWVQFKDASGKIGFNLVYSEWLKKESWGDVYETQSQIIEGITAGVVGIKINKTDEYENGDADGNFAGDRYDKHLRQICLQDQGVKSNITVVGVWLGTTEEYEAALAGNKPQVNPVKELAADGATGGWGEKTFDASTCTGTIVAKDAAIGWWLGGTDCTNYDNFVCELENVKIPASVDDNGDSNAYFQGYIQYADGTDSKVADLKEGSYTVVIPLGVGKSSINQLGFQGSAGIQFTIKKAFFATAEKTPTGVNHTFVAPKANVNAPIYNLAGQQVSKAYKGVVIQNGKKFVQK